MTVFELIAHLQKWPSDCRVVVEDYQLGYADVGLPLSIAITPQSTDKGQLSTGSYAEDFDGEEAVLISATLPT